MFQPNRELLPGILPVGFLLTWIASLILLSKGGLPNNSGKFVVLSLLLRHCRLLPDDEATWLQSAGAGGFLGRQTCPPGVPGRDRKSPELR